MHPPHSLSLSLSLSLQERLSQAERDKEEGEMVWEQKKDELEGRVTEVHGSAFILLSPSLSSLSPSLCFVYIARV